MPTTTSQLLDPILAAHGGEARWRQVDTIEAAFSSGGLAFSLHMQPWALQGLRIAVRPHARQVTLIDYGGPGRRGLWTPDQVSLVDADGRILAQRRQPRASFSRLDRQVRWDRLDLLYFAGYALWNYLSFPFILAQPGVELLAGEPATATRPGRLEARFDDSVPSHCRRQTFHVDQAGLLLRHDYTADVIGPWAQAANLCLASQTVDGLRFYTRRQVRPRLGPDRVLPIPRLVWIELDDLQLRSA